MYYLEEIMDRTFDSWSRMLGANDYSFWGSAEIEMKPIPTTAETTETESVPTPAETPSWEPADTTAWSKYTEDSCDSNPVNDTVQNIANVAKEVIEDINPWTDSESNNS
tara:strand:- start:64 stop:390 length:327 start_codon:yes stop_codon:yes gene_type:complete